jgi:RNA polymerase sigma factor (sigma-70 family)
MRCNEAGLADATLLESYVASANADAFAALVRRHGPMVWSVCHRLLRDSHDADDAFQATFLVLVHKAASISPRYAVGSWLYGVAYHTALKARAAAYRRRVMERRAAERAPDAKYKVSELDVWPLLYQVLQALPEKYRAPIVLCDLEGKTRKEAARELGWPEGTVAGRLVRARALLARRLNRHGLAAAITTVGIAGADATARTFCPAALTAINQSPSTVTGVATTRATSLAEVVIRSMVLAKLRNATMALLIAIGIATLAFGIAARSVLAPDSAPRRPTTPPTPAAHRLVAELNDSARRIRSLKISALDLECRRGGESCCAIATFLCRKPGSFRLVGVLAGQKAFDIGCNDRTCWYWLRKDDPPLLHRFPLQRLAAGDTGWPLPCRPEWLLESLGLVGIDPAKPCNVIARPGTFELIEKVETKRSRAAEKVTVFRASSAPVWPVERLMRDARGVVLCRAIVRDIFTDPNSGATLPREVEWYWPEKGLKVRAKLTQVESNPSLDEEEWNAAFSCPVTNCRSPTRTVRGAR